MKLFLDHLKKNILHHNGSKRIFHGRGKFFEEYDYFNIDYFSPYLILVFYKEPTEEFLISLRNELINFNQFTEIKGIVYQKRFLAKSPSDIIYGDVPNEFNCILDGLSFNLRFNSSQNLGLFLDIEKGRAFIKNNSKNKTILNLFSYTCSLSVVALSSGAKKVVNMDMSKMAIRRGYENHILNNLDVKKVKFYDHDIFKSFGKIKKEGPYDLIIIDPPSDHGEHFKIERDYPKLFRRLDDWLSSQGEVMICLNSPHYNFKFLIDLVRSTNPNLELKDTFGFPDYFMEQNPDSGLKITIWKRKEI